MLVSCNNVRLTLNRLRNEEIAILTTPKSIQPVFKPSILRHVSRLSSDVTISLVPFAPINSASVPVGCHKVSNYLTNRKETFDYCSVADEVENICEEKNIVGAKLHRQPLFLSQTITLSELKCQTDRKRQKPSLIPFSSQNGMVDLHRKDQRQIDVSTSRRKEFGTSTQIHPLEVGVPHPDRENQNKVPSKWRASGRGNHEVSKLMSDECKELKRKGLEDILLSNQRVTRCRTKSHSVSNSSEAFHHLN